MKTSARRWYTAADVFCEFHIATSDSSAIGLELKAFSSLSRNGNILMLDSHCCIFINFPYQNCTWQHINLINNECFTQSRTTWEGIYGLSWPSGTDKIDILKAAPVSNSAGHTRLPTFSSTNRSNSHILSHRALAQSFQRQGDTLPPVCICIAFAPVSAIASALQ